MSEKIAEIQRYRTHHRDDEFWTIPPTPAAPAQVPAEVVEMKSYRGRPFAKGHDSRRHKFSTEECQRGFQAALESIIIRHPNAIMPDGRHIACVFLRNKAA